MTNYQPWRKRLLLLMLSLMLAVALSPAYVAQGDEPDGERKIFLPLIGNGSTGPDEHEPETPPEATEPLSAASIASLVQSQSRSWGTGTIPWEETFSGQSDGTTSDFGSTAWYSNRDSGNASVFYERFYGYGSGSQFVWYSHVIDTSTADAVDVSMDIRSYGTLESSGSYQDYLVVYYIVDGDTTPIITHYGRVNNNNGPKTIGLSGIIGDTVQVVVYGITTAGDEGYWWDNVQVSPAQASGPPMPMARKSFTGISDNTTSDNGSTAWFATRDWNYRVHEERFKSRSSGGPAEWTTEVIDISAAGEVSVSLDIQSEGELYGTGSDPDYMRLYYRVDGGPEVLFEERLGAFKQ